MRSKTALISGQGPNQTFTSVCLNVAFIISHYWLNLLALSRFWCFCYRTRHLIRTTWRPKKGITATRWNLSMFGSWTVVHRHPALLFRMAYSKRLFPQLADWLLRQWTVDFQHLLRRVPGQLERCCMSCSHRCTVDLPQSGAPGSPHETCSLLEALARFLACSRRPEREIHEIEAKTNSIDHFLRSSSYRCYAPTSHCSGSSCHYLCNGDWSHQSSENNRTRWLNHGDII